MTTPPLAPPPAASVRPPTRVGAVVLVVIGSVLALMTLGLRAGGGFLMRAEQTPPDASGYLPSGPGSLSAQSYAIAPSSLDLNFSGRFWPVDQNALGKVRITVSGASPSGVFMGIAPRADALSYLNGVAYDGLSDLHFLPYRVTYTPHGGGAPASPPRVGDVLAGTGIWSWNADADLDGGAGAVDRRDHERRRFASSSCRRLGRSDRPVPVRARSRPAHLRRHRAGAGRGAAQPGHRHAQQTTGRRTVAGRRAPATSGPRAGSAT